MFQLHLHKPIRLKTEIFAISVLIPKRGSNKHSSKSNSL